MALELDLYRFNDQYTSINQSETTLGLVFKFTPDNSRFDNFISPAMGAIPKNISSLIIMGGSLNSWYPMHRGRPISAIPGHVSSLNLRGNNLFYECTGDDSWAKVIPANVTSLDLSQNCESSEFMGVQAAVELKDFEKFCTLLPKTISTLTFSADNLPKELTKEQLKILLTGVKNLIVVNADGMPLTDHNCAFTRDQAPAPQVAATKPVPVVEKPKAAAAHPESADKDYDTPIQAAISPTFLVAATKPVPVVEKPKAAAAHPESADKDYDTPIQAAISPTFFMQVMQYASLAVAAIGVCMLALSPFVIAGAAVAAVGAVGFFAVRRMAPSKPTHTREAQPQNGDFEVTAQR